VSSASAGEFYCPHDLRVIIKDILEKFSWHPWSPFSGDNLLLLYKRQKRMKWMESVALDRDVVGELQKLPNIKSSLENVKKVGPYPDSREVLNYCRFLLETIPSHKLEKMTLHAGSFEENEPPIQERELHDSSTQSGLSTSHRIIVDL
jgi:hypothetical protein